MPRQIWAPLTLARLTTDPTDDENGSIWWRSDTSQVYASDGNPGRRLVVGPTGNLPVVRSGAWHSLPAYGSVAAITPVASRAYALPLYPGQKCTLTGVAAEVTLLGLGNLRAGVYTSNASNLPGNLLQDFGTVATGLAGVKTWSVSQALRPILYWLVLVQQGLVAVGLRARDTSEPIVSDASPLLSQHLNAYYVDGVAGALPASFGAPAGSVQGPSTVVQLT